MSLVDIGAMLIVLATAIMFLHFRDRGGFLVASGLTLAGFSHH